MSPIVFAFGPLRVTLLGLFSMIGAVAALFVIRRESRRKGWPEGRLETAIAAVLISAVAGARLYYAIVFNPAAFIAEPLRIFAFHEGGLSIQGGLIGGIIGGIAAFRFRVRTFLRAADTIAPGLILAQAIGRIGCDVFGVRTSPSLPWAVRTGESFLHPAQMYEAGLDYLLFLGLWSIRDRIGRDGELFLFYLMGFSVNRFTVEFFRSNPPGWGPLSVAHVTALVMFAAAGVVLLGLRRFAVPADSAPDPPVPAATKRTTVLIVAAMMAVSVTIYYLIYAGW